METESNWQNERERERERERGREVGDVDFRERGWFP